MYKVFSEFLKGVDKYTKTEALIYMLINSSECTFNSSTREMAKQWGWSKSCVCNFLKYLCQKGVIFVQNGVTGKTVVFVEKGTLDGTLSGTLDGTLKNVISSCISDFFVSLKENNVDTLGTPSGTPDGTPKENKKENGSSPCNPYYIKEINKESYKKTQSNKLDIRNKSPEDADEDTEDNTPSLAQNKPIPLEKKKEDCDKREKVFYEELRPYVKEYGKEMIRSFYDYWTERNKSGTKMRYESQPTWETSKRLATWYKRNSSRQWNGTC